jgi:CRISPR-associated endonuclease/helicase Cas3
VVHSLGGEEVPVSDFVTWFEATTGRRPYDWQRAFGQEERCGHRLVRIPTGFGKTLGVLGAWLHRRVVVGDDRWPRRLVWTLPMRVLVEQTAEVVRGVLAKLGLLWEPSSDDPGHRGRVGLHTLMGGSEAADWHLYPEHPAVLVGTQDMLLSRALNRGYGAARARWPTDFGLLSQDVLWVLDEVQLMDVGLATASQLAAFRLDDERGGRPAFTWSMSATLQKDWVTQSPDTTRWAATLGDVSLGHADRADTLWSQTRKPLRREGEMAPRDLAKMIVDRHAALPSPAPLTLMVANTVERARQLYIEVRKAVAGVAGPPRVHLVHSRFRGVERDAWRRDFLGTEPELPARSRIVVATQVIEAGVDLSADLLFTEVCPWPSLVQRLGRLARRGGTGEAVVLELDTSRASAPYDAADLDAAWAALESLSDGAPRALEAFEEENPSLIPSLYPYQPSQLLLREELDELFDTTPDLTGADLDVSRYIRSGDERDLTVFWIEGEPDAALRPVREGLCAVPFLAARDWLCGKRQGQSEPRRLREGVDAWVWDYLDGSWRRPERGDLWPGQRVLVDVASGGYDPELGWDPASKKRFPLVAPARAGAQELADSAQDQEDLSATSASWQTIGFHGGAVAREVADIARGMVPDATLSLLHLAARWHDVGKAHPAFQGAIVEPRPARRDLAKAPRSAWRKGRNMYRLSETDSRPGFRHELASALGLFGVLVRHAAPNHPSRLGALASLVDLPRATEIRPCGPLEAEILELAPHDFDLVAYLVCCHHGKVRTRLHAAPSDQAAAARGGDMPIRGVRHGDALPPTPIADAAGALHELPATELLLEPAVLGLSPVTGRSWAERVDGLIERHGPFALAWLEAILRAADVRASRDERLVDPALTREALP